MLSRLVQNHIRQPIAERLARPEARGRLHEFCDECWRSFQLVLLFVIGGFLFGAPLPQFSAARDTAEVRPASTRMVVVSESNVVPHAIASSSIASAPQGLVE
jgi:hypothetical protein